MLVGGWGVLVASLVAGAVFGEALYAAWYVDLLRRAACFAGVWLLAVAVPPEPRLAVRVATAIGFAVWFAVLLTGLQGLPLRIVGETGRVAADTAYMGLVVWHAQRLGKRDLGVLAILSIVANWLPAAGSAMLGHPQWVAEACHSAVDPLVLVFAAIRLRNAERAIARAG